MRLAGRPSLGLPPAPGEELLQVRWREPDQPPDPMVSDPTFGGQPVDLLHRAAEHPRHGSCVQQGIHHVLLVDPCRRCNRHVGPRKGRLGPFLSLCFVRRIGDQTAPKSVIGRTAEGVPRGRAVVRAAAMARVGSGLHTTVVPVKMLRTSRDAARFIPPHAETPCTRPTASHAPPGGGYGDDLQSHSDR
jgi:hypothetical protein